MSVPTPQRTAFLLGAGHTLPRLLAHALVKQGVAVALCGLHPAVLETLASEIESAGGQALVCVADVGNKMAMQSALYLVYETWGRLDLFIHNEFAAPSGDFLKLDEYDWERTLSTTLKSAFLAGQTAARLMKDRIQTDGGSGALLFLVTGSNWQSPASLPLTTAYHGLVGLSLSSASQLLPLGIRVHALISPTGADIMQGANPQPEAPDDLPRLLEKALELCDADCKIVDTLIFG